MTEREIMESILSHMTEDVGDRDDDKEIVDFDGYKTAIVCKKQYDSFIKVGFNPGQALSLLVALMEEI